MTSSEYRVGDHVSFKRGKRLPAATGKIEKTHILHVVRDRHGNRHVLNDDELSKAKDDG